MQARGEKHTSSDRFKEHGQLFFIGTALAKPNALFAYNHCLFSHLENAFPMPGTTAI